ncbi:DUF2911 domain-containing protein [Edaphobacter albus]|uniref:DUF2911 domain-containing protein n=1 Tax=Edaphobacter sp. 4G125 TaxID=2763071 RepID=UPI0016487319|nr:DUF2911 domain-containing protein [Edaphobacter sp. 4G125]QNI36438.1 DUF2911 domain-containing protein [Edaphobacter sp. 4G125]
MLLRSLASFACTILLAGSTLAQAPKSIPSPPETATVSLNGKAITVKYGAPSMRGRKIVGALVPYDKVWRTGANEATSFVTATNLKIGDTQVPAGSYTLFTLPSSGQWMLIINKQTGEWGLSYDQSKDLARIPMKSGSLASPQERMSISFENTKGNSTELHVKWENADQSVKITAE